MAPPKLPVKAEANDDDGLRMRTTMPLKMLEGFCQRMGTGLRSGVDLLRLLDAESRQGSSTHREATKHVIDKIRKGLTLADSMKSVGRYYPHMLVQMVTAGEAGGGLERIFLYMSEYYRDLRTSRNDFLQRLSWPVIQLVLAFLIISLVIVIQGFLGPENPGPNDLVFDASGLGLRGMSGLMIFWAFILIVLGTMGVIAYGIWKNWFQAHRLLVPIAIKIPVIGTVLATTALSRLSMTLAMLLNAGVEAKRCLREAFRSTGNHYYLGGLPAAEAQIVKGSSFAEAFDASQVLPNDFVRSIEVGELSGTETDSLERLAHDYNAKAKTALAQLAMSASVAIWMAISLFLIFMIIRMFMSYVNVLNNAGKM